MTPAPISPEEARTQIRKKYDRHAGRWAADAAAGLPPATLGLPLHPPTERQALANQQAAISWAQSWSAAGKDAHVEWGERRWASLGTQRLPERVSLPGPGDIARFAGRSGHWDRLSSRFDRLAEECGQGSPEFIPALPRSATEIAAMNDADFHRLLGVLAWLAANPDSHLYIRQLPIRGVDSKWVGARRPLVERLHRAATGRNNLGLASRPDLIRVRFPDPQLAPAGLSDLSAPLTELATLELKPRTVFVFENLETVLAMPPMPGAVVVHGSGYAVDRLARLPWVVASRILYWGDLDSHGFAILNRLRSFGLDVMTVLMDLATLDAFADLCVVEPQPATGSLQHLLPNELTVVDALRERGNLRLEQERLDWQYSLETLAAAHGL